jgi:hypothetical protein
MSFIFILKILVFFLMGHAIGYFVKKVVFIFFLLLVAIFVSAAAFIGFMLFLYIFYHVTFQTSHTQIYSGVFLLGGVVGYMRTKFEWPN